MDLMHFYRYVKSLLLRIGPIDVLSLISFFFFYRSEGGYFKAHLIFPKEYPQRPPKMTFVSEFWHPNGKYARTYCVNLFSNTF